MGEKRYETNNWAFSREIKSKSFEVLIKTELKNNSN